MCSLYSMFRVRMLNNPGPAQNDAKHTHKAKDRVTRTPLKPEVNSGAPEG
jgi:hypothetical protein